MKKNNFKKIIAIVFSFVLLVSGQNVFSATSSAVWNNAPNDCPDINIANYTTGVGFGNPCWTGTNINANPGETINVRIYYHNTSNQTANNTYIKLNTSGGSSTNHSFSARITSNLGDNLYSNNVTVNIPTSQSVIFGSTRWYPNQTQTPANFLNGQNGSEVISSQGLYIGNIAPGWSTQGSVVVSFHITNNQPQNCTIDSFTANPNTITVGQSSTLSWNTTNCNSASINQGIGSVSVDGTRAVSPTSTTTYTLTATGANGGSVTKNVTVNVNAVYNSCVINNFIATPPTINQGGSSNLGWYTSDCAYVKLYNGNTLINTYHGMSGSQSVSPTQTTTYTLKGYSTNNSNTSTKTTTVIVNQAPQNCVINSFTANPNTVTPGGLSTLSWSTTNCNKATISDSTRSHNVSVSGSESVRPLQTTTYKLTASGLNGVVKTKSVTIIVRTISQPMTGSLTASYSSCTISAGNSSCMIPFTWETHNPVKISAVTNNGVTVATGNNATNKLLNVSYGTQKFYLYNNGLELDNETVGARCVSGSAWNGSRCVRDVVNKCSISYFMANPETIEQGGYSTLSWSTTNCNNVKISNIGNVDLTGTQNVFPSVTTTYTLTATGTNSLPITKSVTVVVKGHSTVCLIDDFKASPTTITNGDYSVLTWHTTNCNRVTISNLNYNIPLSGSQEVWPNQTTTYTLTATGAYGNIQTKQVTVIVNTINNSCTINNFKASPSYIDQGEQSVLYWDTNNCQRVTVDGREVANSGEMIVRPNYTKSYILRAHGFNGSSVSEEATVYVNENNNNCRIIDFSASDTSIDEGDSTTLRWETEDCERVRITDLGNVSDDGDERVYPDNDRTYVLTAYDFDGRTITDSIRINVDEDNNSGDRCRINSFTADRTYLNQGDEVELRWRTTDCDDVSISNFGDVDEDGSEIFYPNNSTTYTLRARGDNGSDSESVRITVGGNNLVYNTNVVTTIATNISQTGAQLNGLITNSNYNNADTYFEYGTSVNMGMRTASRGTSGNSYFNDYVSNLSPNTIYYFRAVGEGSNGVSRGAIEVFRTLGYVNQNNNITNTRIIRETVVEQGNTVYGSLSPIMLRIENRYQTIGIDDVIDYTVYYKNISISRLTNPMVQVYVPKGVVITNSSRGTFSNESRTLSVPIEDLNPNDEGVIYLQAVVEDLDSNLAQIVTTAVLIYTNPNGAQENAMAYVLNNPKIVNGNNLGASAFFGNILGLSLIGWLLLIIIIMLLVLLSRSYYSHRNTTTDRSTH